MRKDKSCGAVVYTRDGDGIRYVISRSKTGIYGFPKGHVEGIESERETALREVLEETGLTVQLMDDFRKEDCYSFVCENQTILKQVVYFLGEYSNQVPVPQEAEVSEICLMDYETAMSVFRFENLKETLTQAHQRLTRWGDNSSDAT